MVRTQFSIPQEPLKVKVADVERHMERVAHSREDKKCEEDARCGCCRVVIDDLAPDEDENLWKLHSQ